MLGHYKLRYDRGWTPLFSRPPACRIYTREHVRSTPATPTAAVDEAIDILDGRVQRYKTRARSGERAKHSGESIRYAPPDPSGRVAAAETEAVEEAEESEARENESGQIVRTERFNMEPMTVDAAILQFELLGHAFFLFLNAEDKQYCVLYRRADGDYGLIAPKVGV